MATLQEIKESKMTTTEALRVLKRYQKWRLGGNLAMLHPKEVTEAINTAISELDRRVKITDKKVAK